MKSCLKVFLDVVKSFGASTMFPVYDSGEKSNVSRKTY